MPPLALAVSAQWSVLAVAVGIGAALARLRGRGAALREPLRAGPRRAAMSLAVRAHDVFCLYRRRAGTRQLRAGDPGRGSR